MDHAPGPISAKLTANTANMAIFQIWAGDEKAIHPSAHPATTPATGVHKPAMSRTPASAPITWVAVNSPLGVAIALYTRAAPTSKRWIKSPAPGGPAANVENSRCKCIPFSAYGSGNGFETFHSAEAAPHFWGIYSSMIPRLSPMVTA